MDNPNKDGVEQTPNLEKDPYEELKGQVDENGVPKHPVEKAEYYQTKFSESSRGAQELLEKNRILATENEKLKEPKYTQEDLSALIPGFDTLTTEQQKIIAAQQEDLDKLKNTVAVMLDKQTFEDGFRALVKKEEFAILKKRKDDFKDYAYSDDYRSISNLEIIARDYIMKHKLFAIPPETEKNKETPSEIPEHPGLDGGKGGLKPTLNNTGITAEEAATMREKDPQKYNRLAASGKLKIKED